MSVTPTATAPPQLPRKGMASRPPKITINNKLPYGSCTRAPQTPFTPPGKPQFAVGGMSPFMGGTLPPFTATTNVNTNGAPVWPPYKTSYFSKGFEGFRDFAKAGLSSGEKSAYWLYSKFSRLSKRWFTHIFLFTVVIIYSVLGALIFQAVEAPSEKRQMENMRSQRNELLTKLRTLSLDSEIMRDADRWEGRALAYIREYKHILIDSFQEEPPKLKWSFWNTMFYCGTIYTTIGYGHISPTTVVGRAVTIVYATIGIPIFLILLADFGKLFTRCIKFLWAFVRRLYYTGTFRKLRKHQHVQQVMHGMNVVYEIAMRRPTLTNIGVLDSEKGDEPKTSGTPQSVHDNYGSTAGTPTSPIPETYMVDDEFNLPISVAIVILLLYIFLGAGVYCIWEDWTYFESVYFVFISMSTIGFGDFVPQHPIFMMCSIAYLMFGLALTSMCINVVQVKLSNSFRQASTKIGATIGFEMSDEEGMSTQNQTPIECASIYSRSESKDTVGLGLNACSSDLHHKHSNDRSPPPIPCRLTTRIHDKKKPKEKSKNVKKSKGNANNK